MSHSRVLILEHIEANNRYMFYIYNRIKIKADGKARTLVIKDAELNDSGIIKAVTKSNERECELQVIGRFIIRYVFERKFKL